MNRTSSRFLLLGIALALCCQTASAGLIIDFFRVTNNAANNVADQLEVELFSEAEAESEFSIDVPAGNVLFAFRNDVGDASSISEIYFDDGTIIGAPTIFNSLGGSTSYTLGANPGNLPSGNTVSPAFVATATFSVDAVGNPSKGVDTAIDVLGLAFDLQPGLDLGDVVASLVNGDLRIGMHLRAIGQQSDSFVNNPPPPIDPTGDPDIPEPTALALFAAGLLGAGVVRR